MSRSFEIDVKLTGILIILLFMEVSHVNSFSEPCDSSPQTIEVVRHCPNDTNSYLKAAARKNCGQQRVNCSSFEYHCVLNDHENETIEVCAPSIFIIGEVCAKFNLHSNSIFRIEGRRCNESDPPCGYRYNSTQSYKYPGCFRIKQDKEILTTTQIPNSSEDFRSSVLSTEEYDSQTSSSPDFVPDIHMSTSSQNSSLSEGSIVAIVIGAILAIIIILFIVLTCWKMKRQNLSFAKAATAVLCFCARENTRKDPRSSAVHSRLQETEMNNGTHDSLHHLLDTANEPNVSSGEQGDHAGLVNGSPQLQDSYENIENTGTGERSSVMCSCEQITESNNGTDSSLDPLLKSTNESNISSGNQADHAGLVNISPQLEDSNENISMVQTPNTTHPDVSENLTEKNNGSSIPLNRRDQDNNVDRRTSYQPEPNQNCEPKTRISHDEEEVSNFANSLPDIPSNSTPSHPEQLQIQHGSIGRLAEESRLASLNTIIPCHNVDNTDSHTTQVVSPQMKSSVPVSCTSPGDKESISSPTPSDKKNFLNPPHFLSSETLPLEGAISNPTESFTDGYCNHGYNDNVHRTPSQIKMPVMVTEGNQNNTDQPPMQVENLLKDVEKTGMPPPQSKQANVKKKLKLGGTVPEPMMPYKEPQDEDVMSDTEFEEKVKQIVKEQFEMNFQELQRQLQREIENNKILQEELYQTKCELLQKKQENVEKDKLLLQKDRDYFELEKKFHELEKKNENSQQKIKDLERKLKEYGDKKNFPPESRNN